MVWPLIDSTGAAWDDELRLVDRATDGDEDAFRILYSRYYARVFAIAKGVVLDAEEAEDMAQEAFTLAFRNLKRFDRRSKFSTWLFRIAVNRSIQQARNTKGRKRLVPLDDNAEAVPAKPEAAANDPDIEAAMGRLQPLDRAVITLFYWDELSLIEIGESLGCSANAAKTRLFRARERFREAYEEAVS
ncbi:MAG: sigma-70 family RNA polymerase sigma factor [Armatimonadetes bacterium]|nr:sigma-70 family RNA polymerase sigma factor [Armatimonadota bacterium]